MTVVGERLHAALAPLAYADQAGDLANLCEAIGGMFEQVAELAAPGPQGQPGWSQLLDVNRCPAYALPWLGQLVGVDVDTTLTDDLQRQQIAAESGMSRGSVQAIVAAAQRTLIGTKTVALLERSSSACPSEPAYGLTVFTFLAETPDTNATLAALEQAKPAGIVLQYLTRTGWDFEGVREGYTTFTAVEAAFDNFSDMRVNNPT